MTTLSIPTPAVQTATTGSVRLLRRVRPGAVGVIAINGKRYECTLATDGYRLATHATATTAGVVYEINYHMDHCSCPAYRHRAGPCKHCKALAALWKAGKLP